MDIKKVISSIGIGAGAIILGLGIQYAMANWTQAPPSPPNCTDPNIPGCNAPINVSSSAQTKNGPFTVNFDDIQQIGLKVLGQIQIIDGNQGAGKVLTSDANGNGSWSTPIIPPGAIMAFNLSTCPSGWNPYSAAAGRTVIGTGAATGNTSARSLGDVGGAETVGLSSSNIPSVTATINGSEQNVQEGTSLIYSTVWTGQSSTNISTKAGNTPVNVMQPYIAELYCVKI